MQRSKRLVPWLPWLFGLSFLGLGSLVPFLALTLREQGIDGMALTATMAALPLSRLLAGPAWSMLADRFQAPGRMVQIGALIAVVGAFMLYKAPMGMPVFIVAAMGVHAIGRGPAGPVIDSMALQHLPDRAAYGGVRRWGSLGFMVGVVLVGFALDHTRVGLMAIVLAVSVAFLGLTLAMPKVDAMERATIGPALRRFSADPFVLWMLPAAALHFAPHVGNTAFLAVHLDGLGHSTFWTSMAITGGVLLEVVLLGKSKELLGRFGARRLLIGSMALAIPRWGLMVVLEDPIAITLVGTLHGITFGMFWIAAVSLMNRRAPAEIVTSAQGLLAAAVGGVGSLLGMVGSSWVVSRWDTVTMYEIAILMGLAGLLCASMAVRRA